jgi:tRNA threonylcarbamoyladenosine biosynthesis protein TsaB
MIILGIRTDKPEAELYLYKDKEKLAEIKWHAHKELSKTIHHQIEKILDSSSINLQQLEGIICFKGPGSFTGLRIGLSVANALAYANQVPILARKNNNWLQEGITDLLAGKNDKIATPFYDRPAATTKAKK